MSQTKVLIVDDQAMVRAGFRMVLESQADIRVVGEAADGSEAVDACARLRPDVVVMDIRMPRMDGVAATERITDRAEAGDPRPRVLILTTFDLDEYVYSAIEAGASGFMLKDAPPEALLDAVRVVARGDALLAPSVTRRLLAEFAAARRPATDAAHGLAELTERETDVLRLLAQGLSNGEIAEQLIVGEATVKTHVSHVLGKLDLRDRVQAVVFAYESGLVRPGE